MVALAVVCGAWVAVTTGDEPDLPPSQPTPTQITAPSTTTTAEPFGFRQPDGFCVRTDPASAERLGATPDRRCERQPP